MSASLHKRPRPRVPEDLWISTAKASGQEEPSSSTFSVEDTSTSLGNSVEKQIELMARNARAEVNREDSADRRKKILSYLANVTFTEKILVSGLETLRETKQRLQHALLEHRSQLRATAPPERSSETAVTGAEPMSRHVKLSESTTSANLPRGSGQELYTSPKAAGEDTTLLSPRKRERSNWKLSAALISESISLKAKTKTALTPRSPRPQPFTALAPLSPPAVEKIPTSGRRESVDDFITRLEHLVKGAEFNFEALQEGTQPSPAQREREKQRNTQRGSSPHRVQPLPKSSNIPVSPSKPGATLPSFAGPSLNQGPAIMRPTLARLKLDGHNQRSWEEATAARASRSKVHPLFPVPHRSVMLADLDADSLDEHDHGDDDAAVLDAQQKEFSVAATQHSHSNQSTLALSRDNGAVDAFQSTPRNKRSPNSSRKVVEFTPGALWEPRKQLCSSPADRLPPPPEKPESSGLRRKEKVRQIVQLTGPRLYDSSFEAVNRTTPTRSGRSFSSPQGSNGGWDGFVPETRNYELTLSPDSVGVDH